MNDSAAAEVRKSFYILQDTVGLYLNVHIMNGMLSF